MPARPSDRDERAAVLDSIQRDDASDRSIEGAVQTGGQQPGGPHCQVCRAGDEFIRTKLVDRLLVTEAAIVMVPQPAQRGELKGVPAKGAGGASAQQPLAGWSTSGMISVWVGAI